MADQRIHPREDSTPKSTLPKMPSFHEDQTNSVPQPPPSTYIIHIPKDQIYRVPPSENAKRYQHLSRRKPRLTAFQCCFYSLLGVLVFFIIFAGIFAGIFYLVFRPESPDYSIVSMKIKGFNLTSWAPISLEFDVTVRANNRNDKLGFYYRTGSSVDVFYGDVRLGSGVWPVFYQGSNNVSIFTTSLKESVTKLTSGVRNELVEGQRNGMVPFKVKLTVPARIKVGSVKTWRITVKVDCDLTVDQLTANAKVTKTDCDYSVNIW